MKVTWHRAHETVEAHDLDNTVGEYRNRPYYYEIPVLREDLSRYLDYPTSDFLAVSIVIAQHSEYDQYPELLCKRAFWFIKNLCERTDIKENFVPIQLSIDAAVENRFIPYAEACQFPLDKVNWFDSDRGKGGLWKYEPFFGDVFRKKERVLHIDLSLSIGLHQTQRLLPLFERIRLFWSRDNQMALIGPLFNNQKESVPSPLKNSKRQDVVLKGMAEYMGHSYETEKRYWNESAFLYYAPGTLVGIHRNLLDNPAFKDEMFQLTRMTLSDEQALACYFRKHNWTPAEVADLSRCFWYSGKITGNSLYKESQIMFAQHTSEPDYWKMWLSLHT